MYNNERWFGSVRTSTLKQSSWRGLVVRKGASTQTESQRDGSGISNIVDEGRSVFKEVLGWDRFVRQGRFHTRKEQTVLSNRTSTTKNEQTTNR